MAYNPDLYAKNVVAFKIGITGNIGCATCGNNTGLTKEQQLKAQKELQEEIKALQDLQNMAIEKASLSPERDYNQLQSLRTIRETQDAMLQKRAEIQSIDTAIIEQEAAQAVAELYSAKTASIVEKSRGRKKKG